MKKMIEKLDKALLQELSAKISDSIGYLLGADCIYHIHEDGAGYYYYIRGLKPGYPVLAMAYWGYLMLILPFEDFQRLGRGEIGVDDYIESSHFSYGYYWGGGGMIRGGYWQPLEEGTGIHDTERISRYLHILACRTDKMSSGYGPTESQCQECQLDATACPFSPLNQAGSWGNEVHEPDGRVRLFKAINERLKRELGMELSIRQLHTGGRNELRLYPGGEPYTIEAQVSGDLLNDLLYHPNQEYDWQQMAEDFEISIHQRSNPDYKIVLPKGPSHGQTMCLEIWRGSCCTEMQSTDNKRQICLALWPQEVERWDNIIKAKSLKKSDSSASHITDAASGTVKGHKHKLRNAIAAFVKLARGR